MDSLTPDVVLLRKGAEAANLISDRKYFLKTYKQCFVARDFIGFLSEFLGISRPMAVSVARGLQKQGHIEHVLGSEIAFEDEHLFFRFSGPPLAGSLLSDTNEVRSKQLTRSAELRRSLLLLQNANLLADRKFLGKTYSSCFVAREAVTVLCEAYGISREESLRIGKALDENQLISHVFGLRFSDAYLFFRFSTDESSEEEEYLSMSSTSEALLWPINQHRDFVTEFPSRFGQVQVVVFRATFPRVQIDSMEPWSMCDIVLLADVVVLACRGETRTFFLNDLVEMIVFNQGFSVLLVCAESGCSLGIHGTSKEEMDAFVKQLHVASEALRASIRSWFTQQLLDKSCLILDALLQKLVPYEDTDGCTALIDVFSLGNSEPFLIEYIAKTEVLRTSSSELLFRENSLASFLVVHLMKAYGKVYLERTVFSVIDGHDDGLIMAKEIPDALAREVPILPKVLRNVWSVLAQTAEAKFSGSSRYVLSSFIFLRFVCFALVDPLSWGYSKDVSKERMHELKR